MSVDELRALDVSGVVRMIAAGHTLDHDEEYDVVRALVVAWPGLLGRVEAAEAERQELDEALDQAVQSMNELGRAVLDAEADLAAAEAERDAYLKRVDETVVRAQRNEVRAIEAEAERDALRAFVNGLALASLLDIRRAAFAPEIGVRYTEAIRADIANACFRLEDACTAALAASVPSGPAAGGET